MELHVTEKQLAFIESKAFETLFGGAAGGGKSFAQLIDGLVFALRYPGSRQLMLRRTFPELRRSLILQSLALYPQETGKFLESVHKWQFVNGSVIEFGFCDSENDVTRYQSAEYDVIRFDELTHFTSFQFTYMLSRIRGVNGFPKQVKATTNPGGIGHAWVKSRYIDCLTPGEEKKGKLFLPARVQDNRFLMKQDPGYIERLMKLDERDRKALLYGQWDLFEGQYFSEFSREIHICQPFHIPGDWRRYLTIDYGLDMLAAYWIALSPDGFAYVYREVYESGLILSQAAAKILEAEKGDCVYQRIAPPDLWNRRQETGRSAIEIFEENGLYFDKCDNTRETGWYALKEYLHPFTGEDGKKTARLKLFPCCCNLIRTLPALLADAKNPNDVSSSPHELTHGPDAIRGFAVTVRPGDNTVGPAETCGEINAFLEYGLYP